MTITNIFLQPGSVLSVKVKMHRDLSQRPFVDLCFCFDRDRSRKTLHVRIEIFCAKISTLSLDLFDFFEDTVFLKS